MKFKLIIFIALLSAFLPCSGQEYFKLMGDTASFQNYMMGAIKLQQGGCISYGKLYVNSFGNLVPVICKTDDAGNLVWQKYVQFTGLDHISTGLELPSGELMFFNTYESAVYNDNFIVFKTDSAGNILWTKTYSSAFQEWRSTHDVIMSHDNNILLGTTIGSNFSGWGEQNVIKLDTSGNILWNSGFRTQNGGADWIRALREGPEHCIYTIG